MRIHLAVAGLAFLASAPAHAQAQTNPAAPPVTCGQLAADFASIESTPQTEIEDLPDGCRMTNFYVGLDSYMRYRIGELRVTGPNLLAEYATQLVPAELDLAISGFTIAPQTGNPLNDYIFEVQSEPMEIHVAYRWDRDADTLELADVSVTAPDYGAMRLSGRVIGFDIDPASLDELDMPPGGIDQLVVELDNARFFSAMLAPSILGMLPYDEDPRPLIDAYQKAALAFVEGLPVEMVSADTKAAVTAFITSFPKVRGDYRLELRPDPPLAFDALDLEDLPDFLSLLQRAQVAVTHTPAEQP